MDLTTSEKRTIIIILVVILISAVVQIFSSSSANAPRIDYSESDSLFSRLSHVLPQISSQQSEVQFQEKGTESDRSKVATPKNGNFRLNINNASEKDFTQLPRIGPAIAKRIIMYRESKGLFKSNDDLLNIKGIGPKTLEKIKPFLQRIE